MTRNWDYILWATGLLAQKYKENTVANARVMREYLGLITNVVLSWTKVCPVLLQGCNPALKGAIQPSRGSNLNFNL